MERMSIEKKGQACILRYSGELTLEVIDSLKDEIEGYLSGDECMVLVMDLSQTVFLDSSGIGFLVHINNRKTTKNKEFYLLAPSPQVRKTLNLVKLIDFFNILEQEDEIPEGTL
jgi:anti-sigma B factor antagonist